MKDKQRCTLAIDPAAYALLKENSTSDRKLGEAATAAILHYYQPVGLLERMELRLARIEAALSEVAPSPSRSPQPAAAGSGPSTSSGAGGR